MLDRSLSEFDAHARQAIFDAGGWIVRADAMSMLAVFEDVPDQNSSHAARALDAALGVVLASRLAKRRGESALPNRVSLDVSVGCAVHTGEVIAARLTVGGHLSPCIAGLTAERGPRGSYDRDLHLIYWGSAIRRRSTPRPPPRRQPVHE